MSQRSTTRILPIPELLRRGKHKWRIRPSDADRGLTPQSDLVRGHMVVPLDESDASAWVRRHEMAHVAWSPRTIDCDDALVPYVQAVEDARVNLLLQKHRFPTVTHRTLGVVENHVSEQMATDAASAMLTRVSLAGTSDERDAARPLVARPDLAQAANDALRVVRSRLADPSVTLEAARMLRDVIETRKAEASRPDGPSRSGSGSEPPTSTPVPPPSIILPPLPTPEPRPSPSSPARDGKDAPPPCPLVVKVVRYDPSTEPVDTRPKWEDRLRSASTSVDPYTRRWGTMTVKHVPLPLRLGRAVGRGKRRPSDCGPIPHRMERWASDRAVFATRGRQRAGTVLLDASGSMAIPATEIEAMVRTAPAATMAMYSGVHDHGDLYILAQRGRRVASIPRHLEGNIIDGPALRWLARQKAPRIWVCDEMVTGIGDYFSGTLLQEARQICRTFGILRVPTIAEARAVLGGARRKEILV